MEIDRCLNEMSAQVNLIYYNSEKAKSMLYSIKDKEMAIAAAKWIAQQLPLGNSIVFASVVVFCCLVRSIFFFCFMLNAIQQVL